MSDVLSIIAKLTRIYGEYVYVEKVYEDGDFSKLKIPLPEPEPD